MNNRYSTIMECIEVTPQMHERIMKKINAVDFEKIPIKNTYHGYRKPLTIAACFLMLFAGIWGINGIMTKQSKPPLQSGPHTQVVPDIEEFDSIDELSQHVGFEVKDIESVPFTVEKKTYSLYWDNLSEITYTGDTEELVFRKALGSDDVSGDYTEYSSEKSCTIGDFTVTLKGNDDTYNLALWQKDGYSYSIMVLDGISESEMTAMIESAK
ncbi:MAG: hypothetical protein VB119_03205 [Candidatus Metalachnospira sp.]|nr:hypothetical protein [Candidatus Metalachnospira sp.]